MKLLRTVSSEESVLWSAEAAMEVENPPRRAAAVIPITAIAMRTSTRVSPASPSLLACLAWCEGRCASGPSEVVGVRRATIALSEDIQSRAACWSRHRLCNEE